MKQIVSRVQAQSFSDSISYFAVIILFRELIIQTEEDEPQVMQQNDRQIVKISIEDILTSDSTIVLAADIGFAD